MHNMKKHKKISLTLFIISLGVVIPTVVFDPVVDYFCPSYSQGGRECISFASNIIEPVFWSFLSLSPFAFISLFLRREIFITWMKFAAIGFPLMFGILFYEFHSPQPSGSWVGGPTELQIMSVVLPALFLLISLVIIIYKSIKLYGK